jgi:ABC-type sugar transport system ATPase subunit
MLDHSVSDNILLGETGVRGSAIRDLRAERRRAAAVVERLGVRTRSLKTPVRWLSGGNQQKVVLARWLNVNARVMVLDEPTAGVDVGAKLEIYALLRDLAAQGAALVVCSSDYDELKLLASRVIVLRRGSIAGELAPGEVTESSLLNLALGAA